MPDDIKALAVPVLSHRIIPKTETRLQGCTEEVLLREVLDTVPVPAEKRRLC
jgi:MoxR-like ATPase